MKNTIKKKLLLITLAALVVSGAGCAMLVEALWDAGMEQFNKPLAIAGFTTKTMKGGGYKIVVSNMRRGAITSTLRIDKSSSTYDAVFFDVEMMNIGRRKLASFGLSFKLITDQGNVVEANSMFKGGFDGEWSDKKSSDLWPGTKKSGIVAFALNKNSNPKKLLYETHYGKALSCDLP